MPKINVPTCRNNLREQVFSLLGLPTGDFKKVNASTYGIILIDPNGEEAYVRFSPTIAMPANGKTARQLMEEEIASYEATQEKKAKSKAASAEKAAKDKAKRDAMAAAKKAVEEKFSNEEGE